MKKKIERIIQFIISFIILIAIFKYIDFDLFFQSLKEGNIFLLVTALIITPFALLIRVYRWALILNKDELKITIKNTYLITIIGTALSNILPSEGGDIVRAYYGYKKLGIKEEMLSSSIVDKLLGILGLFMIAVLSSLLYQYYWFLGISIFFTITFFIIIFSPQLLPWEILNKILFLLLKKKLDVQKLTYSTTLSHKLKLVTLLLSIFAWIATYFQYFLIFWAFDATVNFFYLLTVGPLIAIARLIPITLCGWGTNEAMVIYLFKQIGVIPEVSLAAALIFRVMNYIIPGLAGVGVILFFKARC